MLRVFMRVPGVDLIDFSGVHNQRTPVDGRAHHPTCAHVSDSAESDKRETQNALRMSDSPETDIQRAKTCVYLSDSPESDTMGVRNGAAERRRNGVIIHVIFHRS